jgi:hypothetical protein
MNLLSATLAAVFLTAAVLPAQIPSYSSNEEYCAKNPDALTCRDGKPIDVQKEMQKVMEDNLKHWCEMVPNDPKCAGITPDKKPNTTKPRAVAHPRTAPSSAPSETAVPQASRPNEYQLPPPGPRFAKKGTPADFRLGEMDWRTVPKDSDMLIGIDMGSFVESDLACALLREWTSRMGVTQAEQDRLLETLGSVSQVVVSIHGKEIVAIMIGRLDDLQEGAQLGGLKVARLSADTLALGSQWSLTFVRHRLHFPLEETPLLHDARELARSSQFWAVARPSALAAFGKPASPNSPVKQVKFGVSLTDQFRMDIKIDTVSPETATQILESSQKGAPRGLQSSVEGSTAHFALVYDRNTTLARFGSFMTDSLGKQFASLVAAAREMASRNTAPARPAPGKVLIEGLDDGPKEVTMGKKQ